MPEVRDLVISVFQPVKRMICAFQVMKLTKFGKGNNNNNFKKVFKPRQGEGGGDGGFKKKLMNGEGKKLNGSTNGTSAENARSFPKKTDLFGDGPVKRKWETEEDDPKPERRTKPGNKGAHHHQKPARPGQKEQPAVKHRDGQKWFQYQVDARIEDAARDRLEDARTRELEDEADLALRTDADLYTRSLRSESGSEAAWLQTIMQRGTAGDKKTAVSMQTKSSPVHSLSFVRAMVHTVERKNVREAMDLIPQLAELFVQELLPPKRKLVSFGSRPLARLGELSSQSVQARKRLLVLWKFEHDLKSVYERFTKALESIAGGAVEGLCVKCLSAAALLLAERPEQEQFLLTLLVNKMGHPNKKVALKAEMLLSELARKQMNMRPVMVTEVERLLYRRNVSERAQTHAATFLSQLVLRAGESTLAVQLLTIYFGLFKTLVAARKTEHKLVGILLQGANRAFPYAKDQTDRLSEDIDALYRLVHQAPFGVALQTLKLLHHVLNLSSSLSDRYYSSLYRKLLEHAPVSTQHQLLDLLWKTLKADQVEQRVRAFVKRLLQLATNESAGFAASILLLVSRLCEDRPGLVIREREPMNALVFGTTLKRPATKGKREGRDEEAEENNEVEEIGLDEDGEDDDDEEHYVDLDDDGRPLARGVKKEEEGRGVKGEEDEEIAELSFNVGLESSSKKKPWEEEDKKNKKPLRGMLAPLPTKGWVHRKNQAHHGGTSLYDPTARNPLFASSQGTFDAELALLSAHYHPSVGVFARSLLEGNSISYGGEPLNDFTTIAFLDRFVYRNPKTVKERKEAKKTDKAVTAPKRREVVGVKALPVASQEYVTKRREEIPADERFLHRFASIKFAKPEKKKKKKTTDAEDEDDFDDAGSVDSLEFEQVMARFEPGEKNEEFDIDFGQEFTAEKQKTKKKAQKRKVSEEDDEDEEAEEDGEDDEGLSEGEEDVEEEEDDEDNEDEEENEDDDDDDDDEDDDDVEIEGEESDEDLLPMKARKGGNDDEDSEDDEEYGENDAFVSGDRFAQAMEEFGEGETAEQRKARLKRKVRHPKGAGRRQRRK